MSSDHSSELKDERLLRDEISRAFLPILENSTVDDVLKLKPSHKIEQLNHNVTVATAMKTLADHKILSAPVLSAAGVEEIGDFGDYMGLVTTESILHHFLRHVPEGSEKDLEKTKDFWEQLLITITSDNDVSYIHAGEVHKLTLYQLFMGYFFRKDRHPIHRLAVFDARVRVTNIISQSDLLRFVSRHIKEMKADENDTTHADKHHSRLDKLTIKQLQLGLQEVQTVHLKDRALDAFRIMEEKSLSGLGVVDEDGYLVGNLSQSDLRGLHAQDIDKLLQPVQEFLSLDLKRLSLLYALPSFSLKTVVDLLVKHKVHRIYVVESEECKKPIGVITLTDILKLLGGVE